MIKIFWLFNVKIIFFNLKIFLNDIVLKWKYVKNKYRKNINF